MRRRALDEAGRSGPDSLQPGSPSPQPLSETGEQTIATDTLSAEYVAPLQVALPKVIQEGGLPGHHAEGAADALPLLAKGDRTPEKNETFVTYLAELLKTDEEILRSTPPLHMHWEIRAATTDRLQAAYVPQGATKGDRLPGSKTVNRALYEKAVGHQP